MIFKGVCTALVTPFDDNNEIDYPAAKKLVEYQLKNGVGALLVLGSTGEGFSLTETEKTNFVKFVKNLLPQKVKLVVGVGSNNAGEVVKQASQYKALGADAILVTTPFFIKCSQQGIIEHFKQINKGVCLPIIVYNIPGRSGVNIKPETMLTLCKFKNIVALKEANDQIGHILDMFNKVGDKISIYCGNDNLNAVFSRLGAAGTISVSSNIFPKHLVGNFYKKGNYADKLHNFNKLLFCEPNPIPIKYALSKMGLIKNNLRLPLTKLSRENQKLIDANLNDLKDLL